MTNNIAGATTATANGNAGGGGGGGGSATGAAAAQNETSNLFSRKGTVHDLAQVLIEDCQKVNPLILNIPNIRIYIMILV